MAEFQRFLYIDRSVFGVSGRLEPGEAVISKSSRLYSLDNGEKTEEEWREQYGEHISKLQTGTIVLITIGTGRWKNLVGHEVKLGPSGIISDLGVPQLEEINSWDGVGQDFFAAYLRFAGENAAYTVTGIGAVRLFAHLVRLGKLRLSAELVGRGVRLIK